jgi:hypothetical protein
MMVIVGHFSIVSEAGASIYSASEQAQKELPDLDVSVRGAGKLLLKSQHLFFEFSLL